jgi:hypothetical protein
MTVKSRAPNFEVLGVKVEAALAVTAEGVAEVALGDVPEVPVDVTDAIVVLPEVDKVVAAVPVLTADDPVEVWTKIPPEVEDTLDVAEGLALEPTDDGEVFPSHSSLIWMLS